MIVRRIGTILEAIKSKPWRTAKRTRRQRKEVDEEGRKEAQERQEGNTAGRLKTNETADHKEDSSSVPTSVSLEHKKR